VRTRVCVDACLQLEREELQTQNHLLQQQLAESQAQVCMWVCVITGVKEKHLLKLCGLQAKTALERASRAEQLASDTRQLAAAKEQVSLCAHTYTCVCVCFTYIPHRMQHIVECNLTETNVLATCLKITEQGSFAAGGSRDQKVANHRHDSAGP
jgi:hypothetical protein